MLVGNVFSVMNTILIDKILCFSIELKPISLEDIYLHHQKTCIKISQCAQWENITNMYKNLTMCVIENITNMIKYKLD